MKIDLKKILSEIMQEIPEYTIPESYVKSIIEENIDCFDTRSEVLAETKMQLTEESGMEFMLTRREAEDYLCDEFTDEKWAEISRDGVVSSRIVKAIEENDVSTLYELIKNMPLIPLAKLISSIVMKNLEEYGVDPEQVNAEALCVSVIEDLNTSLGEIDGTFEEDEDDDDEEDEDVFDEMGITFETEENEADAGIPGMPSNSTRARRSRITRFPGRK